MQGKLDKTTTLSPPTFMVVDPICGMEFDPVQAVGKCRSGEKTYYFCSDNCLAQFDRENTTSDQGPTRLADQPGALQRVELPVSDLEGYHGASRLEEQLTRLLGVQKV